jgi:hypothetical protein
MHYQDGPGILFSISGRRASLGSRSSRIKWGIAEFFIATSATTAIGWVSGLRLKEERRIGWHPIVGNALRRCRVGCGDVKSNLCRKAAAAQSGSTPLARKEPAMSPRSSIENTPEPSALVGQTPPTVPQKSMRQMPRFGSMCPFRVERVTTFSHTWRWFAPGSLGRQVVA